jgi:hypothetical protein
MPIVFEARKKNIEVYFSTCGEDLLATQSDLDDMQTVNDVLMVGYPNGLYDETHYLPLIRKGITSSHPAIDFDGKSIGVVDIGCFEGSSGSPIYTYPGISQYKKSTGDVIGQSNAKLIGVLFGGAIADIDGKVTAKKPVITASKATIEMWLNLGYYIKSREISALKDTLKSKYNLK